MSVISSKKKALAQLEHKSNIADILRKDPVEKILEESEKGRVEHNKITHSEGQKSTQGGNVKIPEDIKVMAGALRIVEGVTSASEAMGVSKPIASHAAQGIETRREGVNHDFAQKVLDKKEEIAAPIRAKAINIIGAALDTITPEKLNAAKLREASAVAKDMASVVEKLTPQAQGGVAVSFHFHAPRTRKENEYVIKEVN